MASSNLDAIRRAYDAFLRRDIPRVLAEFDPAIHWVEPDLPGLPWAGTHHGREAVERDVFGRVFARYDEFAMEPQRFVEVGETVVVTGRLRGRARSGARLDAPFAHVWKLRHGKAVRMENHAGPGWDEADVPRLLESLGLIAY